ncbi:septal ring lytic transglycosylase RlpA family protein [Halomonas sp. KAO]|uniref:septal ring lytic transglycosylase RlpA family protein n=1 Tax=unclassified Halomonas TaxID=2609666 RepID=UPI00189F1417|nr:MULTISPECIES: septal ring lytic transglycosylase RlpA family protein [unclassified Halomonas]MBF7054297.1 septal ring lytic transglycosylase RlpA family protein [Halomonas sp. KAO]MDT0501728.1 septal ring lytic transglycosylase RlpA family protein [Halomonas sp. PAR7]MDT0513442.1 septal ring lytic transglycosylase RlpA family protein [Halomonas sp. LES1]MDT0591791.1 septal ring lytic transglycosylase RlpA family protein [Halomonas sp. PAR8]
MGTRTRLMLTCCLAGLLALGTAASVHAHDASAETQQGYASFYADKFQGRTTASGVPFDQNRLTAAHRHLPFGTEVEVERPDTGQKVTVVINDRGPFVRGRIIDLSKRAARKLGLLDRGVAPVVVTQIN